MTESKEDLAGNKLQEPETGDLNGSEVVAVERTWTTLDMLKMSEAGMSNVAIGRKVGLTAEGVRMRLKKHKAETEGIETFKENEVNILAGKRKIILDSLSERDIRNTKSIRDRAVTYGILTDKARLLDGASTANIGVNLKWTDLVREAHARGTGDDWQTKRKALSAKGLDPDFEDQEYQARARARLAAEAPELLPAHDAYMAAQGEKWAKEKEAKP